MGYLNESVERFEELITRADLDRADEEELVEYFRKQVLASYRNGVTQGKRMAGGAKPRRGRSVKMDTSAPSATV